MTSLEASQIETKVPAGSGRALAGVEALAEFEAQGRLEPGDAGWWKVWGASVQHVQVGDIVISRDVDGEMTCTDYVADTFEAKSAPMRRGFIDQNGDRFTLGALVPIVLVRRGTGNTLA